MLCILNWKHTLFSLLLTSCYRSKSDKETDNHFWIDSWVFFFRCILFSDLTESRNVRLGQFSGSTGADYIPAGKSNTNSADSAWDKPTCTSRVRNFCLSTCPVWDNWCCSVKQRLRKVAKTLPVSWDRWQVLKRFDPCSRFWTSMQCLLQNEPCLHFMRQHMNLLGFYGMQVLPKNQSDSDKLHVASA